VRERYAPQLKGVEQSIQAVRIRLG
jgi:hypothetical protein